MHLDVPIQRKAHISDLVFKLPEPFDASNKLIPLSLRKSTLEKMYSAFVEELKSKHSFVVEENDNNEYYSPFAKMTYEKEQKIASTCTKKTLYVSEMAAHLYHLKRESIPEWIKGKKKIKHSTNVSYGPGHSSNCTDQCTLMNDHQCEPRANEDSIPAKEVLLAMPLSLTEITNYLLSEQQKTAIGIPLESSVLKYRVSTSSSRLPIDAVICERCGISFIPETYYTSQFPSACAHHDGKLRWSTTQNQSKQVKRWSCCEGLRYATACTISPLHVFKFPNFLSPEMVLNAEDSVRVVSYRSAISFSFEDTAAISIVGIDCEMIYTTHGSTLARVTMVGWDTGSVLLDLMVSSTDEVVDYNTTFSGITADSYSSTSSIPTCSFEEAQEKVLSVLSVKKLVILVGHSIENDLLALKITHPYLIDTTTLFPHHLGTSYRYSLKMLAEQFLKEHIQKENTGHSSLEDARTSLDIFKYKFALDRGLLT